MNMNKMKLNVKNLIVGSFIIVGLILGSCGESVDPTKADVRLEMKATTQLNAINTNARVAETGVEFTDFLIGVTEIEFEGLEGSNSDDNSHSSGDDDDHNGNDDSDDDSDHNGNDDGDEIEYQGQFIVDLIAGTSDPDFGIANVIPGVYKEIKVKIRPILDDGNSVFVKFNYTPDGTNDPVAVEFSTTKEIEFELENHSGIQLDGNSLNQVLILFDVDKLLANVDLSMAEKDEDGVIRINSTSNSSIAAAILSDFHQSCEAGEDDDHDDRFDDDHEDDD
jgi:hypothetical protein